MSDEVALVLLTGVLTVVSGAVGAGLNHKLTASREGQAEARRIAAEGRANTRQDELARQERVRAWKLGQLETLLKVMNLHFASQQARVLGDAARAAELVHRTEDLPTPIMNLCGDDEALRMYADLIADPPTGGSGQTRIAMA